MISSAMLPPIFQILTGLSFATLLVIRFGAASALRPLWGKLIAFAVILIALGCFLMSQATEGTMSRGADLFLYAGISYFVAALLVVAGLFVAARQGAGGTT